MSALDRAQALCDILLGAAFADTHFHEREKVFVRAYLVALCGGELPAELAARIDAFDPADFDLRRAAAAFADDTKGQKRDLLQVVAALNESDDEIDLAEDDYLCALARALRADDALSGLALSYESRELRNHLERLEALVPPLPYRPYIRQAEEDDLPSITAIYNDEVENTAASFDTTPVDVDERRRWLEARDRARHPVVVADMGGEIAGWGALSPWSQKGAYARAAEVSVYVDRARRGAGVGRALLRDLIDRGRRAGLGVLITRICTADGPESLRLHKSLGFQRIGTMRRVGEKAGRLLDVELLDLHLNNDE